MQKINLPAFVATNKKLGKVMETDKSVKLFLLFIFTFFLTLLSHLTFAGNPL
ncbi:MAG: hypothetical protein M0Q21_00530 [Ignavibacteriaceae bacterium]|nr:hypothetical protein [Ignavibacteriaceae bacterium]